MKKAFFVVGLVLAAASMGVGSSLAGGRDIGSTTNGDGQTSANAMFTITNNTNDPMLYYVKWGSDGRWDRVTLAPGFAEDHYFPIDPSGAAPTPYIRFATLDGAGHGVWKGYRLVANEVDDGQAGPMGSSKQYFFQLDGAGRLDLFAQ